MDEEDKSNGRDDDENVKVMVRCRPLMKEERSRAACLETREDGGSIAILGESASSLRREFYFDSVFGPESDNERVYMKSCRRLVEFAFEGYNCTVFLYGQTGTGKTYTHSSLTLNSFAHLFTLIKTSHSGAQFLIRASYFELYNEDIRDLLTPVSLIVTSTMEECSSKYVSRLLTFYAPFSKTHKTSDKPLELRESKGGEVYVKNLTNYLVNNLSELEKLKKKGDERRATAATKMNDHSSRSHSIFSITIERTQNDGGSKSSSIKSVRLGRLNLIDLAGSERQSKSGSTGARLKEASRINLSLTCLSLVIRSLTDPNSSHVPYRNSKLTRLLTSSLGGNSKTLLVACISPAQIHLDETLNTLRFASRTKLVKNRAKINEDSKDALLRKYRAQLEELKQKLHKRLRQETTTDEDLLTTVDGDGEENQSDQLLRKQLKLLKAKIMVGGENLLEKVEMHERLLEASKNELEERKKEELNLKLKLKAKQEAIERMNSTRGGLETQAHELDEKLGRALVLYKQTKEEQRDLVCEHEQLKESLLQSIKTTSKEIRYANCIIDDFIPRQYLDLINSYAQYDDDSDEWQIKLIALSGNNIAQTRNFLSGVAHYSSHPVDDDLSA